MHSSTITRLWQCIIVLGQSISPHSRCLVCGVSVSCSYAGFGFAFEGEIATILGILIPKIPITSVHTCFVAVVVRHIIRQYYSEALSDHS